MKNLFYLFFISALLFASCDEAVSIEEEVVAPPEEVIPTPIPDDKNTPKDFDFTTLMANDTLYIAYSHDLGGKSIQIPSDVVINYNEGEIINGTLVFKEAKIDGKLLNHKLKIEGTPSLISTTFKFEKSKWNIVEEEVSDEVALTNAETLEKLFADIKSYGANVFQIDDLDANFQITSERNRITGRDAAISIPSDFSLEMTDNTYLRVQPNKYARYQLLSILGASNISISGGNLYGDRDSHDYTPITVGGTTYTAHEWGHLISIETGVNIKIDNVYFSHAVGDGIDIHSLKFAFDPNYVGSSNITITNCIFDRNRRNNLSITDGYNMLIEDNTFLNAGVDTQKSKGIDPGYSIDVEAQRSRDANGELKYYQFAKDITIRNNTESGSRVGAFKVAIGENVLIENNTVEGSISFAYASGVKIKGNRITNPGVAAISAGKQKETDTVFDNEISGNIISDASMGIILYNQGVKVFDNSISGCGTGIYMMNLKDAEIYKNTITSNKEKSYGMFGYSGSIDNVLINDNEVNAERDITFSRINLKEGQQNNVVTVKNNDLKGGAVHISNSNGIVVE